jgi:hypothetical protein
VTLLQRPKQGNKKTLTTRKSRICRSLLRASPRTTATQFGDGFILAVLNH